jgi:hypothetical protein
MCNYQCKTVKIVIITAWSMVLLEKLIVTQLSKIALLL